MGFGCALHLTSPPTPHTHHTHTGPVDGQVDAREALQLASQLAAAVAELNSSVPPPAVERDQAEEIVKGLVM